MKLVEGKLYSCLRVKPLWPIWQEHGSTLTHYPTQSIADIPIGGIFLLLEREAKRLGSNMEAYKVLYNGDVGYLFTIHVSDDFREVGK